MLSPDKLWKAIFEDLFPEAIAFYFPEFYPDIDWPRGFEVLDKEQKQIFPESEETHRRVDFLVKVWLLNGKEQWILIHIEVQGYRDEDFPRRMFIYFYRLTDRFNVPVSALAVLTDNDKSWRPGKYEVQCMNTRLIYDYPVFKLADYTDNDFKDSDNPWAWIMRAALIGLKANWDDDSLLKIKVQLYREFREKGYTISKTRLFLQFLKYHVRFDKTDYFGKFDQQIQIVDNKKNSPMGILELVKEHIIEEAWQEGLEKGMEEGIQKGLQKGIQKGLQKGLQKGIQKGIQKGMSKGELAKARNITLRIIEKYPGLTDDEVANLVEMPASFVKKVRQKKEKEKE